MNAPTHLPTAEELAAAIPAGSPRRRSDGWTPPRQRAFLEAIAGCCTIREACARVGLSPASAYAFRNSPVGRLFGIGWDAASLRARGAIHDLAIARVIEGYEERITRQNGEVIVRQRHDNRLMLRMLERLDRTIAYNTSGARAAACAAEREFDTFLDEISDGLAADLAVSEAIGTNAAGLVPADRADWTAAQWRSAEAAGLVALVPVEAEQPETAFGRQDVQLGEEPQPDPDADLRAAATAATPSPREVEQRHRPSKTAFERQDVQLRADPCDAGEAGLRGLLPEFPAGPRVLAPDRKPLHRERPAARADRGLHSLYPHRDADGERPAITADSFERNRPVRKG